MPGGIPFFPYGRGNSGRHRRSTTDLSITQDIRFGGKNVQFAVNILNVFDRDSMTRVENAAWWRTCRSRRNSSSRGWDYEGLLAADPSLLNNRFAQPNQFQAPREIRFTLKFEF